MEKAMEFRVSDSGAMSLVGNSERRSDISRALSVVSATHVNLHAAN